MAAKTYAVERNEKEIVRVALPALPTVKELDTANANLKSVWINALAGKFLPADYKFPLRNDTSLYNKLRALPAGKLYSAWLAKLQTAKRQTSISLGGLIDAAKAAGLIKVNAKAPKAKGEATIVSGLALEIVKILSAGTPATQVKAIRALPEIVAAMDSAADADADADADGETS